MAGKSSKAVLLATILQGAFAVIDPWGRCGGAQCTGTFTPISASAYIDSLNPGWNLGNTLDAIQNEGDWNNPPVVPSTFDSILASGFKSIRLPVTWAYHFTSDSPTWDVDPAWLQRVSDVVDQVTSRGLKALVNVHHDSWTWADVTLANANITQIEEQFYRLWFQIGTKLACKGSSVAFEPINEPPGTTEAHGKEQNRLNGIFLQAINDAGGFNPQRVVTLVGSGEDAVKTSQWFEPPDAKFKNPWGVQFHYYSPYDFIFSAWGKTTWGSAADKAALEADFAAIRGNFTDVPLLLGEWDASNTNTETAGRWRYFDFLLRTAAKYNIPTIIWDNGLDHFDRAAGKWRDETVLKILQSAVKGDVNALPDSTTDTAATSQFSSAFVWNKVGESVKAVSVPYLFNGLTLSSITDTKTSKALVKGTDYSVEGSNVTFSSSFLSTVYTSNATGTLATLSLKFSGGAPLVVQIAQWAPPKLGATSSALPATSADLLIPITWAGQNRPAAVRAIKSDGGILIEDWTQYLGPLQQGRMTYENQWNWDQGNVILKAAVLDAVRAAGKTTAFTFEFYPRVEGNVANYTITV
ncbi:glycoside hydrolase family 5 protein [Periconia macrospinosa]|uniref:Glycoside hydrolase family 5 protein n=1 Tax=Periconia macrospinosa TaxID=97972 RepID=A0A2V1EAF2_9PLEO|nr:glycoside hydrolase family 5 protein [Periconia macrospinosa]